MADRAHNQLDQSKDTGTTLLVFAPDATEAAQIRRIRSYIACGFTVTGFTMRRRGETQDAPFWNNVHLGENEHAKIGQRLRAILAAVPKILRNRAALTGADVIVARNLDMLALAVFSRSLIRPRPPVIYECLDIHGLMTDPGRKGRLARMMERFLLRRCASLIVSSPAFVSQYFAPVQGWIKPVSLVENKMWVGAEGPRRPAPSSVDEDTADRPLKLGWVGALRCAQSLEILSQTAQRLGDKVEIRMSGLVHRHSVPEFDRILARHDNMTYLGPYAYPDDLAGIYSDCDLVWAQDLWQWGTNSSWLLPNRIYEACYFGCPCVAVAGTETGRRVENGLGWTIADPSADALADLLSTLDAVAVRSKRRDILTLPDTTFRQSVHEIKSAILLPLQGDAKPLGTARPNERLSPE